MEASLLDFIQVGSFGALELGMARSAVEQQLGPPPNWSLDRQENRPYHTSIIWKYGDIELYFYSEVLQMIFMDDFSIPDGGDKIKLDPWIISGTLTCDAAR